MKRIFVIVTGLILLLALGVSAVTVNMQQTEDEMIESIVKASSNITSMKCDIAQTRRIPLMDEPQKSSGTMIYIKPSRFSLDYTEPFAWKLKVDGDNIIMGTESAEGEAGRLFKGISSMILGCMSGEMLKDRRTFRVTVTDEGDQWKALLIPVRRDMKKMFGQIELGFDPDTRLLRRLLMEDAGGGSTEILISNVRLNGDYEAEW
ncbi:MAG: outer membrane lipoprotein carrier protein LolA [Bacteroidaceae bacterium]|nr:outer membrane lipoprotein carrier protein LolA [Bacteroidaceae bacterium]MBR6857726.1 outer membrane lipoprotein carrier protein LolA [Bacteroidaceae bacterium]